MKKIIFGLILLNVFVAFSQQNVNLLGDILTKDRIVKVFTSAENTNLRLAKTEELKFTGLSRPSETKVYIFVYPEKEFQKIIGIGGAITDASAEVFAKMPGNKQRDFLKAYYDKTNGIGYSIIRTNMNSCDFGSDSYTYVKDGDKGLKTFNIDHDRKYKIPLIKKAIETAGKGVILYISPWSPPAFMKDNHSMSGGGRLLPEYYKAWSEYYVRFIHSYQKEGIPVWGLTIQNEPMAVQKWESCIYTAEEERDFLKYFLGPTLSKSGLGDKKIIIWDHNRDMISQRVSTILEDKVASKYVWGIGFHWYESWSGGESMFKNIKKVNEMYPGKNLLFTEGCIEKFNPANLQLWGNGERYGSSMINDFNNGVTGWTDWNILLDEKGGPNHADNNCFAPVHYDTRTGELIFTPAYYFIGHFSKFVSRNARRIGCVSSRSQLLATSFKNQDGKICTVVMNKSDMQITYYLRTVKQEVAISILPHAIQTLIY